MASKSPSATTPLARTSSVPQSPIKIAPSSLDQTVPFPPPQTFDFLPQLHGLLLRLLSHPTAAEGNLGGVRTVEDSAESVAPLRLPSTEAIQSQAHQQMPFTTDHAGNNISGPPRTIHTPGTLATIMAADITAFGPNALPPLDFKDLPTAASSIKVRIQKAQSVVDSLPDVNRSVTEQEREIEELQKRIAKLKSVISEFGRRART